MLSVSRTAEFDNEASWTPSLNQAAHMCLKYGILPMKNSDCAKRLLSAGFNGLWDKAAIHNAASFGRCLLYRVSRHRTLAHSCAGVWGSPEYDPLDSNVAPYNGNTNFSGYGKWRSSFSSRWRIPLFCDGHGNVHRNTAAPLETAP